MITKFETVIVDSLPPRKEMDEETFYLSEKTWRSSHLCPTGCGEEIITPHIRGGWSYYKNKDNEVTLSKSIVCDNCKSHYDINKGYAIV